MKNKRIFKTLSALCAALVLMGGFSVTAFAQGTEQPPAEDATNDEDVVVEDSLRGMGIGQWMIDQIMHCPDLAEQHRWLLMTVDAQSFYRKLGFTEPGHPDWIMEYTQPYPTK